MDGSVWSFFGSLGIVTKLEDCRDMASGDYGIEEVSEEVACQRARVNDICSGSIPSVPEAL